MPCYAPWVPAGNSSKRPVACGQCIGCRLEYSRQWAVRIMHEAQMHEHNSFVTLTYKDDPVTLEYDDFRLFMRRLRRLRGYVRFFCAGEYGEKCKRCGESRKVCERYCRQWDPTFGRPHFHAVLFGVQFEDGVYLGKSDAGAPMYSSLELSELWRLGLCSFGRLTFQSAAYVARYVVKKVTGDKAVEHYGERVPEFAQMSRRPGIGDRWLSKFWSDVYPRGKVVMNGVECNPPRYYRKRFAEVNPVAAAALSASYAEEAQKKVEENFPSRLEAKEAVQGARLGMLKRKL